MIKKLLFSGLALASLTASAQMNTAGTGYTLNNLDGSSNCYANSAPNNGGIMSHGTTLEQGPNYLTTSGYELVSVASVPSGGTVTWLAIPTISGSGETAQCVTLNSTNAGIDMSNDSRITVTAEASATGAVLEVFLGGEGQWTPATSTYNTGGGATILASHTFTGTGAETFTFDFASLDATEWGAWSGKNKIQSIGFRSGTDGVTFKVSQVKFGAEADAGGNTGGGGATCSDGIQNGDETGVDCGGSSCSACNTGGNTGGNGSTCQSTSDDGLAEATFYYLLENGSSTTVTCSFDAVNDIKGTFYGALETARLHGSQSKSDPAKYCGMCANVTGPAGTAIVHIADECPDCKDKNTGDTDIDLSPQAFAAIVGSESIGRASITWEEVSCPWTTPIHVIVEGSNQWYAKVIIGNTVNRVAKVEVKQGGTYYELVRRSDNGWESTGSPAEGNINESSKSFRITDIYGEQIEVSGIDFTGNPTNSKTNGPSNFTPCSVTSTENINPMDYINVFPNPAQDQVIFDGLEGVDLVQIVNSVGVVVSSQALGGTTSQAQVNIAGLASGLYVAKFTSATGVAAKTFLKK